MRMCSFACVRSCSSDSTSATVAFKNTSLSFAIDSFWRSRKFSSVSEIDELFVDVFSEVFAVAVEMFVIAVDVSVAALCNEVGAGRRVERGVEVRSIFANLRNNSSFFQS